MTSSYFSREEMKSWPTKLLRNGRAANARVSCVTSPDGQWTVKDFADRSWAVKTFIAPVLLAHEFKILQKLHGVEDIAQKAFMIDRYALAISYAEGTSLSQVAPDTLPTDFFFQMESLLLALHARGVAHLDTRGTGNWLVSSENKPLLIDFQSAVSLRLWPAKIRRVIEMIDLSGVYKKWAAYQPETLDDDRRRLYEQGENWRRRWLLKGYFGKKK